MAQAKEGDTVKVHYTGKLEDGTVFDTSGEGTPIEFNHRRRADHPGVREDVVGMEPGETKTRPLPA